MMDMSKYFEPGDTFEAHNLEFYEYIHANRIRRPGHMDLLNWLRGTDFFEAPASTRFHLSVPGGLATHSRHVYTAMRDLSDYANRVYPGLDIYGKDDSIALVALYHDVCKVGVYHQEPKNVKSYDAADIAAAPSYQVKHDAAGDYVWTTRMAYTFKDPFPYGHGEKSVYLISQFIKLTDEEAMAIRYHMGAWVDGEKNNASAVFEQYPLAYLLHTADEWATFMDESHNVHSLSNF